MIAPKKSLFTTSSQPSAAPIVEGEVVLKEDEVLATYTVRPVQAILTSDVVIQASGVAFNIPVQAESGDYGRVSHSEGFKAGDRVMLIQVSDQMVGEKIAYLDVISSTDTVIRVTHTDNSNDSGVVSGDVFTSGSELAGQRRLPAPLPTQDVRGILVSCSHSPQTRKEQTAATKAILSETVPLAYWGIKTDVDIDFYQRMGTPIYGGEEISITEGDRIDALRIVSAVVKRYAAFFEITYIGLQTN